MTVLPDGWRAAGLKELATSVRKSVDLNSSGTYELWSVPSFADGQPEIVAGADVKSGKLAVQEDDVLICKINPRINRVWLVGERRDWPQVASPEWIVARLSDSQQVSARYLCAYCESPEFRAAITADVSGVTGSHTRAKPAVVMSHQVPVPSLGEQDQIVRILDTELARLDAVMGAVQAVREKAEQFRRSLLHAAFTGQLTQPDPSRGTHVPATWGTSDLGEIASMSLGKMLDKKTATGKHLRPYLRNINVRWGEFDLGDVAEMDIGPSEVERVTVKPGDVVVCEGGEPGRAAVWVGPPIAIQKALHRVRLKDDILPDFIQRHLENEFRGRTTHPLFTGTTIKHLPKDRFKTMAVPVPSRAEQQEIVDLTEAQLARLESVLRVADQVERECGRLRRSLLQAAFTGELTKRWREANG